MIPLAAVGASVSLSVSPLSVASLDLLSPDPLPFFDAALLPPCAGGLLTPARASASLGFL